MQYILKDGIPVRCEDYLRWIVWKSQNDSVVKQDRFDFDVFVSTVFTGMATLSFSGLPMVFETMVYWEDGQSRDTYGTLEAAEAGHAVYEKKIRDLFELPFEKLALLLNETDPLTSFIVRKRLSV